MSKPAPAKAGCEWYATMSGWSLASGNVMVEGTSDVAYFQLAAKLHHARFGRSLLGADFSIFAAGVADDGGTFGISEKFPTLFNLAKYDLDADGNRKYRVIALLDDDSMGRSAMGLITAGHRQIREFESIFRLRRAMPERGESVKDLKSKTEGQNFSNVKIECTIEDMISDDFCSRFTAHCPEAIARPSVTSTVGTHRHWTPAGKRMLREFAERTARLEDVLRLVNALRALRSYVGLPLDGIEN